MSIFINTDREATAVIEGPLTHPGTDQLPSTLKNGPHNRQVVEYVPPTPDFAALSPIPRPSNEGGSQAGPVHTSSPIPTPPPPELTPEVNNCQNRDPEREVGDEIKTEKDGGEAGTSGGGNTQGNAEGNAPQAQKGADSGPESGAGSESESPANSDSSFEGTLGGDHCLFRALCQTAKYNNYCHVCICKQRCFLWHGFQGALCSSCPSYILTLRRVQLVGADTGL